MILFIDCVSPRQVLILSTLERKIIAYHDCIVLMHESTRLCEELDTFLSRQKVTYQDLEHIIVVNGPGSFTGIRTTIILANTINFVIKKKMSAIQYFELFGKYPIIKTSSRRDVFVKKSKNSPIEVLTNAQAEAYLHLHNIQHLSGDASFIHHPKMFSVPDYAKIIKKFKLQDHTLLKAFYIKKPNIS